MSYSMRIGGTRFFLVETMATSKEGKPLLGLYFEIRNNGGVYKVFEREGGNLKRIGTADENLNIFKK